MPSLHPDPGFDYYFKACRKGDASSKAVTVGDSAVRVLADASAGIDVSPAVRDCLGLGSLGLVDWRFVEEADVSAGPWSLYADSTL